MKIRRFNESNSFQDIGHIINYYEDHGFTVRRDEDDYNIDFDEFVNLYFEINSDEVKSIEACLEHCEDFINRLEEFHVILDVTFNVFNENDNYYNMKFLGKNELLQSLKSKSYINLTKRNKWSLYVKTIRRTEFVDKIVSNIKDKDDLFLVTEIITELDYSGQGYKTFGSNIEKK